MQQQNKATAQAQLKSNINGGEWHASDIAGPDPCNSAIKKIAGKQIYLKDKPQALILLQAAEIQRLTNYLNDYKCKYRSISRQPLDRQSYQTQIKELFQRDNTSKLQIDRLNKTITSITITGEQYKKQLLAAQEKYQTLANDNNAITERNKSLQKLLKESRQNYQIYIKKSQTELYSLNSQISSNKTYIESILKNNTDLTARVNTIPNYQRRIFELESQNKYYLEQGQLLNKDLSAKKQKLINQQRGYSTLYERHINLQQSHEGVKKQLDNHARSLQMTKLVLSSLQQQNQKIKGMHDSHLRESTQTITKRADQIEYLNAQLKDINSRFINIQKLNQELRTTLATSQTNHTSLKQEFTKLSDTTKLQQQKLNKYEIQIKTLKQSLSAKELEVILAEKNQRSTVDSWTIKQKQFNDKLTLINQQYERSIIVFKESLYKRDTQSSQLTNKISQLQKALQLARGQLMLSHQIIKTQQVQNEKSTKVSQQQLTKLQGLQQTLNKTIKQKSDHIVELQNLITEYKGKQADLQSKLNAITIKNQSLNKKIADQLQNYNKLINTKTTQFQNQKKQLLNDLKAKSQSHAQQIAKLDQQKSAIIIKHTQLKDKHAQVSQLRSELQSKQSLLNEDNTNLKAKIDNLQNAITKYTLTITQLRHNEELLNKKEKQQTAQNDKIQKELKQLLQKLKSKQSEQQLQKETINKLKGNILKFDAERSCFNIEINELKDNINKLNKETTQLKEIIAKNNQEIAKLKQEREQLSIMFQNKTKQNQGLKRKMIELQTELRDSFEQALKQQKDNHSKVYLLLSKQKQELNKKISELQPHIERAQTLQKHKQILQNTLKTANSNSEIQRNRSITLAQDNQSLRKAIIDTQTKLKEYYGHQLQLRGKLSHQQIDRLIKEINQLKKQKQQLTIDRDQIFEINTTYQSRVTLQMQEIERLHTILNNNIVQNKSELQSIRITNNALQNQIKNLSEKLKLAQKKEQDFATSYKLTSKRIISYEQLLRQLQCEFIEVKLRTSQLRQERDMILKRNDRLIRSIRTLNNQLDNLQKQGDSMSTYFTKQSSIHKDLNARFDIIQDLFNRLQSSKVIIEEKTVQITQSASK